MQQIEIEHDTKSGTQDVYRITCGCGHKTVAYDKVNAIFVAKVHNAEDHGSTFEVHSYGT